ncbi:MAG: SPOR domain-containing protein, partial [Gammaproteobacteria bacterium]|nr:SPOR domain-containing protein [Gammaproteobacteria bacterium]
LQSDVPTVTKTTPTKKVAKKPKSKPARHYETVQGADWFLNLPVKGYTIQVLSARNASSVDSFFDLYGIKKKDFLHYIDNTSAKPLHVIQYGYFDSKQKAMKAAKKMAKGKKEFKPWVRDIKTIRNKIVSL